MAKGPPYTPEDDAILLNHRSTADIVVALAEAGRPERTPAAIKERKRVLNQRTDASWLLATKDYLERELEALQERAAATQKRLDEVKVALVATTLGIDVNDLTPEILDQIQAEAERLTGGAKA